MTTTNYCLELHLAHCAVNERLRARVAELESDARLGAVVQKRIGGRDA